MLINHLGQPFCSNISLSKLSYPILLVFDEKNLAELQVPPNWQGNLYTSKHIYEKIQDNFTPNKVNVCLLESNTPTEIHIEENSKCNLEMFAMPEGIVDDKLIFAYKDGYTVNLYTNVNILTNLNIFMKNKHLISTVRKGIDVLYVEQGPMNDEPQMMFNISLKSLWYLVRPKKMYLVNDKFITNKVLNVCMDLWK